MRIRYVFTKENYNKVATLIKLSAVYENNNCYNMEEPISFGNGRKLLSIKGRLDLYEGPQNKRLIWAYSPDHPFKEQLQKYCISWKELP